MKLREWEEEREGGNGKEMLRETKKGLKTERKEQPHHGKDHICFQYHPRLKQEEDSCFVWSMEKRASVQKMPLHQLNSIQDKGVTIFRFQLGMWSRYGDPLSLSHWSEAMSYGPRSPNISRSMLGGKSRFPSCWLWSHYTIQLCS